MAKNMEIILGINALYIRDGSDYIILLLYLE